MQPKSHSSSSSASAPTSIPNPISYLFNNFKCIDLVRQQTPIIIDSKNLFNDACNILIENRISSAPVYDFDKGVFIGMFDYRDIVEYLLILFHKKNVFKPDSSTYFPHTFNDLYEMAISGEPTTVKIASDISGKNPFYSVFPNDSLLVAVDLLSNVGLHRVNVVNQQGQLVGILSQTDILNHVAKHADLFYAKDFNRENILNASIADLQLGSRSPLISVDAESSVIDALKKMSDANVTSIAVLESTGNIIGNISMTDVKMILKQSQCTSLWMPCAQWVTAVLSQSGLENEGRDRIPVFYVQRHATLLNTIQKVLATKVHRIWVEDDKGRAVGVISLGDILEVLMKHID